MASPDLEDEAAVAATAQAPAPSVRLRMQGVEPQNDLGGSNQPKETKKEREVTVLFDSSQQKADAIAALEPKREELQQPTTVFMLAAAIGMWNFRDAGEGGELRGER